MSLKSLSLALIALTLTAGTAEAAHAHRTVIEAAATVPAACTTSYSTETGADGRAVSVVNMTCQRPALRVAGGAAL